MTNIIYVRHEDSGDEYEIGDSPSETVKSNCFGYSVQSHSSAATNKEEIEGSRNMDVESGNQELTPFVVGIPRQRSISTTTRVSRNLPNNLHGEQVAAGRLIWLVSVASEAIHGWTPCQAHTFEKLHQWSEKRCFDIAGLLSPVLRVRLQAFDPIFSMTLRYLVSIHKGFCFRQGISSPVSDLTERLLIEERDPAPTPQQSMLEAPPFDEVDVQALSRAVDLTRQGAIDSL